MEHTKKSSYKRRRQEPEDKEVQELYRINPYVLELLFVQWFAHGSIPFTIIEYEEFRTLLAYINHDIDAWLPGLVNIVKEWILRVYEEYKTHQKAELAAV
jgi:hypothetical protein